jgi:hypothetical protein
MRSRPGGAERSGAGACDAVQDAPCPIHNDRAGDALRVEGHESTSSGAQGVVGGIGAAPRSITGEAAEVAGGERAHAAEGLVAEQFHRGFAVADGVAVVTIMRWDIAGACGVVVSACGGHSIVVVVFAAPTTDVANSSRFSTPRSSLNRLNC